MFENRYGSTDTFKMAANQRKIIRAHGLLNRVHGLLIRAHGLLNHAHGLLSRAHGLLSHAHGLLICAHGLVNRAHGLARLNNYFPHGTAGAPYVRVHNGKEILVWFWK